jgi:transposase
MVRPYSDDLRERVAGAVADGLTVREVAELFRVSPASVVKWSQRMRATGSAAAKPMGGVRRAVLAGSREWLLARITEAPDLTLQAIRGELAQRGVEVSLWAVWKLFKSEGITFKKKSSAKRTAARADRASA